MVKRALLSVSDKTGITEFARGLQSLGVKIISTGGTAKVLRNAGIEVTDVSEITGFPEMMGGRVKTLHPRIHGGILCLRESKEQMAEAIKEDISLIDMVAVNLYPFEETVSKEGVKLEEAIENIDIGGPTLLRSAAKNYRSVTVLSDPSDYGHVLEELRSTGVISEATRAALAIKAFRHTANYDAAIDVYLSKTLLGENVLRLNFTEGVKLRYGENWHQEAFFYKDPKIEGPTLAKAIQLHGKELSYNNYVDADNALQTVKEIGNVSPAVAIVKHNNPCGLATGSTLLQALQAAWDGDPVSAYGSIICTNEIFDLEAATFLNGKFVEIILAPDFKPDALEFLKKKSENLRLLKLPELREAFGTDYTYKYIIGGMLKQSRDIGLYEKWESVTDIPYPEEKRPLSEFCLKACKTTKSNAVILAHEYEPGYFMVLAMGAGQPNRVDSIRKLAATKAVENLRIIYEREKPAISFEEYKQKIISECVMASDAFFPFDDSIVYAAQNNIRYIVSPGGSIRDSEVIATANRLGVSMIFTGMRHFLH
ncbi:MAG: bifunctional phosphoribosylaminoimidazolecarboxamide formyltransferase/IMP cyclohydrolase [Methanosarcina thermophila]|uniref:IMP cyclohydrolase n=2 Tax=Methanosarcina thermophila TaxID=2210 RepID=A0A1I6X8G1_METTE|nr:bifunctional phosphoribosylaminoimidazolecarboxamide formyltransferase/IMP cyclohydrolase [Methanosarcina thermophila]ALK04598.1 MAG: phosphoribosylaminoimidazolecarboxamide formyltransferase [Methanosarcina sp. 795]AKB16103.1 IMP cyclohydrolase [Methanosarcina thermophila CHTI-55]NLU57222.1 bifunctional phosphoribosylaminoimidazolecarboxamide formyltransferase/IMP cyclohydrolase [Methanosarcina thermophila]SFT34569.1 IMP cyclohydrolase /phosphoribosylaminoimidazolecarboxamide formyltransfer